VNVHVTMALVAPVRYGCQHVAIVVRYRKTFCVMTEHKRRRVASLMSLQMALLQQRHG
jgi:hypothetical protein